MKKKWMNWVAKLLILTMVLSMSTGLSFNVMAEEVDDTWYVNNGSSNTAMFMDIVKDSRVFDGWKNVHNDILSYGLSQKSYRENELYLFANFNDETATLNPFHTHVDPYGDVNYMGYNLQYASSPRNALYEAMRTYKQESIGNPGIYTDAQMDNFLNMWVNDQDISSVEGDTYWVGIESQHHVWDLPTGTWTSRNMVKDMIMFYDFKVNDVTKLITAPPVIKDGNDAHTSTFKAINPNYETIEVTKEYSYTTSREITDVKSVSLENGLSNAFTTGLEVEFPEVAKGTVSNTFTYTFNKTDEWSHGVTTLNEESVTDAVTIPLPPHTTITIDEVAGVREVSRTYAAGSKLSYKVAMIRLYGISDFYVDLLNIVGGFSKTQVYPLAVFGGDNGDAVNNLKQRYIDYNTGKDRDDINWYFNYSNKFSKEPYTSEDGEFIYKTKGTIITPNPILPMYNLDQIIPSIADIDMFEDEAFKLDQITLSALNRFGVAYYGFSQNQDGTWAIVDQDGNVDNSVAVIADGLNGKVVKPVKVGETYLKYIPNNDVRFKVEDKEALSINSHLIPISILPIKITDLMVKGELADLYLNDGNNQVDLSMLSVVAMDESGSELVPSGITWHVEESEGLNIGQGSSAGAVAPGVYHLYARYDDKESNRITLTVYPERKLDSMTVAGSIRDLVWNDPSQNTVDLRSELLVEAKDQYGDDYLIDPSTYEWLVGSTNTNNVKSSVNNHMLIGEVVGMDTITLKVNDLYSTPIVFNIKASPYMNELMYTGEAPEVRPGVPYSLSEIGMIARDQYGSTMNLSDLDLDSIQWEIQEAGNLTAMIENGQLMVSDDLEDGEIAHIVLSASLTGPVKLCTVERIPLKVRAKTELRELYITAPEGLELKLNENANLSSFDVVGYDQYGDVFEVLSEDIQWASSDPSVIEVTDKGTIVGHEIDDKIMLSARVGNVVSNEIELMVYGVRELSQLDIIGAPQSAYTGGSIDLGQLSVRISDQYGKETSLEAIPGDIVWSLEQTSTQSNIGGNFLSIGPKNGDLILKAHVRNTETGELVKNLEGTSTIQVKTYVAPIRPNPTPSPTPVPPLEIIEDDGIVQAGLFDSTDGLYDDVPEDYWAYDDIYALSVLGMIEGITDKLYEPEADITRAEITAFIVNVINVYDEEAREPFDDVTGTDMYQQHIASAYVNKLVEGYSTDSFGPDDSIKREDIVVILIRALQGLKDMELSSYDNCEFLDKADIDIYAREYVASSVEASLIIGYDVTGGKEFRPQNNMTRAEAATLLNRFYKLYVAK